MRILKKNELHIASKLLKEGGLISFPTETVFGFGVVYDNKESYLRLINVKRRPPEKPFTMMLSDVEEIEKYADINELSRLLIGNFMPGQFTIILKAKENLPDYVVSREGNVGIRIPDDDFIRELIREVGKPLLVPSANRSGEPPLVSSNDVAAFFENEIDAVIEGKSISNIPSTIVLVDEQVHLIREGLIKKELIDKIVK